MGIYFYENIEKYKWYANVQKVVKQAHKITDVVKVTKELIHDENMLNIIFAYIMCNEQN